LTASTPDAASAARGEFGGEPGGEFGGEPGGEAGGSVEGEAGGAVWDDGSLIRPSLGL
jgi:hypothetical protein